MGKRQFVFVINWEDYSARWRSHESYIRTQISSPSNPDLFDLHCIRTSTLRPVLPLSVSLSLRPLTCSSSLFFSTHAITVLNPYWSSSSLQITQIRESRPVVSLTLSRSLDLIGSELQISSLSSFNSFAELIWLLKVDPTRIFPFVSSNSCTFSLRQSWLFTFSSCSST